MGKLEEKKLKDFFSSVEKEQKGIMSSRKMDASGQARSMITFKVTGNKGVLFGPDYMLFMERGRGPGRMPPIEPIMKWIEDKGIKPNTSVKSMAFAIAKKHALKGSVMHRTHNPSGIITKTLTEPRIKTFFEDYKEDKRIQVQSLILKGI